MTSATPLALRILVAEPTAMLAAVVANALGELGEVVIYAGDRTRLEATVDARNTDVVVVGPTFPLSGLAPVIPRLVSRGTRTVVVSSRPLDRETAALLLAGASGLLPEVDTSPAELAEAVRRVAMGASALHPDVVHAVLQEWRRERAVSEPDASLTTRELDVLRGLRDGLTTRLIAVRLGIAEKTVETHKSRLFAKLGARNQSQAVQTGSERGLLQGSDERPQAGR